MVRTEAVTKPEEAMVRVFGTTAFALGLLLTILAFSI